MKRVLFISCIISMVFVAAYSFAQMGGQKEGMGSSQMKGREMMSRDMMESMTEMTKHMSQMLEGLSHPMHHMTVTDHKQMHDLGQIMRKMASEMNEMAAHMEKGELDAATAGKMQERAKSIRQEIEALQQKSK